MRVHESWRSNENENLNFHQLSLKFLDMFKVDESAQESILRAHESWWSSETESLNSPKLSSKF